MYILRTGKKNESILKSRDEFLTSEISTIAKTPEGHLFKISRGTDLDMVQSSREEFFNEKFVPQKGDIVIDIGANIGTYTIKQAKRVSKTGKVFAIEADPLTFKTLEENIKLNNLTNVIPINVAVFSEKKKMQLFRTDISCENSLLFKPDAKSIEIQADTLDKILEKYELTKIDWLKIDVEGAEIDVLLGAQEIFDQNESLKLFLEIHSNEYKEKIKEILDKNKFKILSSNKTESTSEFLFAEKTKN